MKSYIMLFAVTPVLQANLEHSYFSPTNPQFEYDRLDICEQIVTKEMGLVSTSTLKEQI